MWILIKRIDSTTTERDLSRFVIKALLPGWLPVLRPRHSAIKRCEILQISNRDSLISEFYGLVQVPNASKAQSLMARLEGARFKGRPVQAHHFQRRIPQRDRRHPFHDWSGDESSDRRKQDRRRSGLRIRIPNAPQLEAVLGVRH